MTTHEKTRLIELLCSGDEANILLAKEICEQQDCTDCVVDAFINLHKEVVRYRDREQDPRCTSKTMQLGEFMKIFGMYDEKGICYCRNLVIKYEQAFVYWRNWLRYYSKHLQSSE